MKEYIKNFVRAEDEDGELLKVLTIAAEEYIKGTTGKQAEGSPLYELAISQLVAHWYENRTPVTSGVVSDVPLTVDAIIKHISVCSEFPEVGKDGADK